MARTKKHPGLRSQLRNAALRSHAHGKDEKLALLGDIPKRHTGKSLKTSNTQPPEGYTFLSIGHADLAQKCKELSREKGVDIRVVSATSTYQDETKNVSAHLHRVGYHIRTDIFDEACTWLGYRFVHGKLVKEELADPTSGFEQAFARYGVDIDSMSSKKATDEESRKVKDAIKELFPRIPEDSLKEIFQTAWQKGAQTVGNAANLPIARRVQLATIAHIRHTYTDYDRILHTVGWQDARKAVEPYCLAKLVEWRGEDDADDEALHGILQDAIMISDDEAPAGQSEAEHYADNEDSSEYEITDRIVNPAELERTPSPYETSPRPSPQNRSEDLARRERLRETMQARWHHARMRARGSDAVSHPTMPSQGFPYQGSNANQIDVPLDSQGRAPRRFIQNGLEFIRADAEANLPASTIGSHVAERNGPYSPHPYGHQMNNAQHNVLSMQANHTRYLPQPLTRPGTAPLVPGSQRVPIQQRFFDLDGREVILDLSQHRLEPASLEPVVLEQIGARTHTSFVAPASQPLQSFNGLPHQYQPASNTPGFVNPYSPAAAKNAHWPAPHVQSNHGNRQPPQMPQQMAYGSSSQHPAYNNQYHSPLPTGPSAANNTVHTATEIATDSEATSSSGSLSSSEDDDDEDYDPSQPSPKYDESPIRGKHAMHYEKHRQMASQRPPLLDYDDPPYEPSQPTEKEGHASLLGQLAPQIEGPMGSKSVQVALPGLGNGYAALQALLMEKLVQAGGVAAQGGAGGSTNAGFGGGGWR